MFCLSSICQSDSNLRDSPVTPRRKYIKGWVLSMAPKTGSDISPNPSPNF